MRLTTAFVAVAVAAVVALAALTLWRTKHTVGRLADERQQATAESIAETLALAYQQKGGWDGVDIHPAAMIGLQTGAAITVQDPTGNEIELRNSMPAMTGIPTVVHSDGAAVKADVAVDGSAVGVVEVVFASNELASAERHVRDALRGTVLLGAFVAATVAAMVALPLSRRIIRPLRRVTDTAHLVGRGDPTARAGDHDAPGELGELAHELRTPLTLLQGSCEEIIDGIAKPTLERFVHIHDDVLRLRRLVDDLNTLADADAAQADRGLRHEPCDLAHIAAEVAGDLAAMIDAHQHQLTLELGPSSVLGDPMRLRQVVTNLLNNAIKYTPTGGQLEIHTSTDATTATVKLTVSDNGSGINPADRPHVFERFYRAANSQTTAGSGIGLAVVDQLVRAHGGTTAIVDRPPGTTIEVILSSHLPY